MSPYEATFGVKPRVGLNSHFPSFMLDGDKFYTEEELEVLLSGEATSQSSQITEHSLDESSLREAPSLGRNS